MISRFCMILMFACSGLTAPAQTAHTPEKGSPERKAILNALRVPLERDLKQRVVFVADDLRVLGNWAFVGGRPQTSDGGEIDYSRSQYAEAVESGAFDNNIFALLKRTAGKWKVTKYAIGCTDVCYADWWRRYRAPKGVFPYTE